MSGMSLKDKQSENPEGQRGGDTFDQCADGLKTVSLVNSHLRELGDHPEIAVVRMRDHH